MNRVKPLFIGCVFFAQPNFQEPVASISHRLATGPWGKVLEEDLKKGGTTTIGQLAAMTCAQVA